MVSGKPRTQRRLKARKKGNKLFSREPKSSPINHPENLKIILEFSRDVLEKRYNSYNWQEAKVLSLITMNGLIVAALFVIVNKVIENKDLRLVIVSLGAIIPLIISFAFLALNIRPKMNRGNVPTKNDNIRTIRGTSKYRTNDLYNEQFLKLDLHEMIRLNTEQIRAMNANLLISNKEITNAAIWTTISIFMSIVLLLFYLLG